MEQFDRWTDTFAGYVADKGKVSPGRWRAFDYKAPGHFVHDAKLLLRDYRMRVGLAPADSSPAEQDRLGINRDRTLSPEKGEGEKLRDK